MTAKNIKDFQVVTIDVGHSYPPAYSFVIKDKNGEFVNPANFPHKLWGASFQLRKHEAEREAE